MAKILEIQGQEHFNEVVKNNERVMFFFHADWCVGCKQNLPDVESAAQGVTKVKFCSVDIAGDNMKIANTLGVQTLPTFAFYQQGKFVAAIPGVKNEDQILQLLAGDVYD